MELRIDRSAPEPVWRQIHRQIRDRILSGSLPPGTRLPPERILAAQLGVNRATVVVAYRELAGDGLVAARVGSGTRVVGPGVHRTAETPPPPFDWTAYLAARPWPEEPPLHREVRSVRSGGRPRISLAHGEMSPDLIPTDLLLALVREAERADLTWGYGPVAGDPRLREAIAARMANAGPDQVLITAGAQHGLALVARAFTEPGDSVVVETPSYHRSLLLFHNLGLKAVPVPVDAEGLRTDALAALLARQKPRLIFVSPAFQNPTGTTLAPSRRRELLALARYQGTVVVESDSYGELWFERRHPPLRDEDPAGPVLYVGSFSKTVAPGLRVGWLVAPPPVTERLAQVKGQQENSPPALEQWLLAQLLARGWYDEHVERLRAALRRRRDALVAALERHLPDCSWHAPGGGYHLWLTPPEGVSTLAWFRAAARMGVWVMPGDLYGSAGGVRLSFSYAPEEALEEGVRRLARALRAVRRAERRPDPGPVV